MYVSTIPAQQQGSVPILLQPQYNIQQQNLIPVTTNNNRSLGLIVVGVTQLIVSCILFIICIWIVSIDSEYHTNYLTIFCCIYHVSLSIIAIIGGRDVSKHRCIIGGCMAMAIVGVSIIAATTFGFNAYFLLDAVGYCRHYYNDSHFDNYLMLYCTRVQSALIPVVIGVCIQAIVDIVISVVNCVNICQCCGAQAKIVTPGQIIYPQIYPQPQYNSQPFISNPAYSVQQPPYNPANAPPIQDPPSYDYNAQQQNAIA